MAQETPTLYAHVHTGYKATSRADTILSDALEKSGEPFPLPIQSNSIFIVKTADNATDRTKCKLEKNLKNDSYIENSKNPKM